MLRESPSFYLPNLYTFENNNAFLGSFQGLRFYAKPILPEKGSEEKATLTGCVWYGEKCRELSEMQGEITLPLTAEGREAYIDWLEQEYQRYLAVQGKGAVE